MAARRRPGEIRDAINRALAGKAGGATVGEIRDAVEKDLGGDIAASSIRSYLNLNEGTQYVRVGRGRYRLRGRG